MNDFLGRITAPALQKLVDALNLFVTDSWQLRKIQAKNTARAKYFHQGTLTGTTVLLIEEAQQSDQTFSALYLATDRNSGFGRYMIDGTNPSPGNGTAGSAVGFEVIDQGAAIRVAGHENVKGFRMVAEQGETIYYSLNVFE